MSKYKPGRLTIVNQYETECEFWVGETQIGRATHDDLGWSGIDALRNTMQAFADAMSIEVEEVYEDEEE